MVFGSRSNLRIRDHRSIARNPTVFYSYDAMKALGRILERYKPLFGTPISTWRHWGVITVVATVFVLIPQDLLSDWELNTAGFGGDLLRIYENRNYVYPPWALVLLMPYYWLRISGARMVSILVIGWLCARRQRSLVVFGSIVLNPFFVFTITYSNADILVFVLPVLLWEAVNETRWRAPGRGLALSLLLLKPQGAILLLPYLLLTRRLVWREILVPFVIVAMFIVPISLIGRPPLIIQWIGNLLSPSPQNVEFWVENNISLSSATSPFYAVLIIMTLALAFRLLSTRYLPWTKDHALASLLLLSMFLSPYTSNQSLAAAFAFVPSWALTAVVSIGLGIINFFGVYWHNDPWWALLFATAALFLYKPKIGDRPGG